MSAAWLPELQTGVCAVKECSCETVPGSVCLFFHLKGVLERSLVNHLLVMERHSLPEGVGLIMLIKMMCVV